MEMNKDYKHNPLPGFDPKISEKLKKLYEEGLLTRISPENAIEKLNFPSEHDEKLSSSLNIHGNGTIDEIPTQHYPYIEKIETRLSNQLNKNIDYKKTIGVDAYEKIHNMLGHNLRITISGNQIFGTILQYPTEEQWTALQKLDDYMRDNLGWNYVYYQVDVAGVYYESGIRKKIYGPLLKGQYISDLKHQLYSEDKDFLEFLKKKTEINNIRFSKLNSDILKIANVFDKLGCYKYADQIQKMIKKSGSNNDYNKVMFNHMNEIKNNKEINEDIKREFLNQSQYTYKPNEDKGDILDFSLSTYSDTVDLPLVLHNDGSVQVLPNHHTEVLSNAAHIAHFGSKGAYHQAFQDYINNPMYNKDPFEVLKPYSGDTYLTTYVIFNGAMRVYIEANTYGRSAIKKYKVTFQTFGPPDMKQIQSIDELLSQPYLKNADIVFVIDKFNHDDLNEVDLDTDPIQGTWEYVRPQVLKYIQENGKNVDYISRIQKMREFRNQIDEPKSQKPPQIFKPQNYNPKLLKEILKETPINPPSYTRETGAATNIFRRVK